MPNDADARHSAASARPASRPLRAIGLKLMAVFLFMVMASLIKATAGQVPPWEAVFFRSFFAIPVIVAWLAWRHELATGFRVRSPMGHMLRGLAGTASMMLGFAALGLLPLPDVTALGYASPLLTVALAALFLGEKVRAFRWTAVSVGLAGVLVILWPKLSLGNGGPLGDAAALGAILTLASALLRSVAQISIRHLVAYETTSAIVFWFSVTSSLVALATIPFGWVVPGPAEAAMLVLAGLVGGVAQILLTSAYRLAPASVVAPFDYASMLFAIAIGYFVFSEMPDGWTIAGSTVVIGAGLLIVWRERQLGLRRGRARPLKTPFG